MPTVLRFIEPCLPSPADRPPSGSNWIHEIKHDGYRLMARRDSVSIRLITRRGNDWSKRFPLGVGGESGGKNEGWQRARCCRCATLTVACVAILVLVAAVTALLS